MMYDTHSGKRDKNSFIQDYFITLNTVVITNDIDRYLRAI